MRYFALTNQQIADLLAQPESGMGYQLIEVEMGEGQWWPAVAYNADLIVFDWPPMPHFIVEKYAIVRSRACRNQERPLAVRMRDLRNTPKSSGVMESRDRDGVPAKEMPPEKSSLHEVFKRFSAYKDDRRISAEFGMLPGTYGTTADDARNVRTGSDAVERYALPNPEPACNVFTIKPVSADLIQRGTVQPAYGRRGGGVEVIFTEGTKAGTVRGPEKISHE